MSFSVPNLLFSDDEEEERHGDFLIRAFLGSLHSIQALGTNGSARSLNHIVGHSRHLLFDFVRILFLANKSVLGKSSFGDVQIKYSPRRPC